MKNSFFVVGSRYIYKPLYNIVDVVDGDDILSIEGEVLKLISIDEGWLLMLCERYDKHVQLLANPIEFEAVE